MKNELSQRQVRSILIVILALYPLVGMGIDLIAPTLPAISRELNTSTFFSKNLISMYLAGYMLGNFFIGFLSDAIGRRKPMLMGFLIFALASLAAAIFSKPYMLLIARFLQGFTIAGFAVCSRAVLSDIMQPEVLIRTVTLIATMWGLGPILGPLIGASLQYHFNWEMCFYFFALMGFAGFLVIGLIIPETHFRRQPLHFHSLKNNFITIMTHKHFVGIVILMGIAYSSLIIFQTLGPFLIQNFFGYSTLFFGRMAFFMGCAFLAGTFLCRRLLLMFTPQTIFSSIIFISIVITFLTSVMAWFYNDSISIVIFSSLVVFLGSGIIYPTAMGKGLSLFSNLAGSSSAIMNLISVAITSLAAFFMGFIQVETVFILSGIYFSIMVLAAIVYYFIAKLPISSS